MVTRNSIRLVCGSQPHLRCAIGILSSRWIRPISWAHSPHVTSMAWVVRVILGSSLTGDRLIMTSAVPMAGVKTVVRPDLPACEVGAIITVPSGLFESRLQRSGRACKPISWSLLGSLASKAKPKCALGLEAIDFGLTRMDRARHSNPILPKQGRAATGATGVPPLVVCIGKRCCGKKRVGCSG